MLNGSVYLPGDTLVITDVGVVTSIMDPGFSLVCMTRHVNTQCCRTNDGGNIGEWFFPNGTMVLRYSGYPRFDFTRTGYTREVRLSRRNNAMTPVGDYECRVPGPDGVNTSAHASVTLALSEWH